jgi:hypothetical protein
MAIGGYVDPDQFWEKIVEKTCSALGPDGDPHHNYTQLFEKHVGAYVRSLESRGNAIEQAVSLEAADQILRQGIVARPKATDAAKKALRDLHLELFGSGDQPPLAQGHRELARKRMETAASANQFFGNVRLALLEPTTGARGGYDCSAGLQQQLRWAMQDARNHGDEAYTRQVLAHARATFIRLGSRTPAEPKPEARTATQAAPTEGAPRIPRKAKPATTPVPERTESRQAFQEAYETVSFWLIQRPSRTKDKAVPGIALEAGKSVQEAGAYWKTYTELALDSVFGYKQDYSVTPTLEAEHTRVMDDVAGRNWEAQRHFIAGGITALLEMIEATADADENAWLTRQVFHLVADSPIAERLKANEGAEGTRESRTREVVINFLVAEIFQYKFSQDGLVVAGNRPMREKVLAALGNFIATDAPKLFTAEQRLICQYLLNARLEYLLSSTYREPKGRKRAKTAEPKAGGLTAQQAEDVRRAFIFGTEGIISLLRKGDFSILHTLLTGIRLVDFYTFDALVRHNQAFHVQLAKMARGDAGRLNAAAAAIAELKPDASPLQAILASWKAGAKMPVGLAYQPFPNDLDLPSVPELVDGSITNSLMLEMLGGMRMFSGVGSDGGATFALDAEHADNPVAAQLFHHYIQILREMVESSEFNRGEARLQHMSGLAFLMWGHMLREAPGTNEVLKQTERAAFFDRLIDILRHPSQYGQPVVDAAHRVVYQCLPYYPEAAIEQYVDQYLHVANHHDSSLVEGGRPTRYLKALAVHRTGYLEVSGTKDMIRPCGAAIAQKLVDQIEKYPTMDGPQFLLPRLFLAKLIGKGVARLQTEEGTGKVTGIVIDPALFDKLYRTDQAITLDPTSFPAQVIGIVGHIGDDKAKAALREALAEALRREMPQLLEITDPEPKSGRAFIRVADEAAARAREALESGFQELAQAVAQLAAMSQPVLAQAQSELADLRTQEDVVAVLQALEEEQAILTAATPQKDMEEAVRRLIVRATEVTPADGILSIQQTLQLIREELPLASLEQLTDVVKQIYSLPGAAGTSEQLSLTDAIALAALVYSQTVVGSERGAAMEQVAALLRDQLKVVSPEKAVELAALTGTIEVPKAMALVQAQAVQALGGTLEHLEQLAAVVEGLQVEEQAVRAERIRELRAIEQQLDEVGDQAAKKEIAAARRVINARIALVESHAEQVEGILARLQEQHAQRLEALGRLITMRDAESQANLRAFVAWLKKIWGADGRANALLEQVELALRAQGFTGRQTILIEAPTVDTILGEKAAKQVQQLQRKALPEAVTR